MTARGFSLIELLVAVTISAVLIFGATQVYVDSRNTYATHEVEARLQETARYALSVIEPDVRMANYWGLVKGLGSSAPGAAAQTGAVSPLTVGMATTCGNNFAVDLGNFVEGNNDAYAVGCAAFNNRPVISADTLTVRRASLALSTVPAATAGPLRICSVRLSPTLLRFAGACTAAPFGQLNDLIVNTYYVDRDSNQGANIPSLRRKSLDPTPNFQDVEIVPGVEDLQVQFGIETSPATAVTRGSATQYVDAVNAATVAAALAASGNQFQIVSVRVWVLVRAEAR
jgi:prepilin-type N-terminal cleavage/methylation domain-containing protein